MSTFSGFDRDAYIAANAEAGYYPCGTDHAGGPCNCDAATLLARVVELDADAAYLAVQLGRARGIHA